MSSITITPAAEAYLAELLQKKGGRDAGIRIYISQPGTPHAESCLAYCNPGEHPGDDVVMGLPSFTVWIDKISEAFLADAVVDYTTDQMGGQLTIRAPNAKVPLVDENSTLEQRIHYYLQTEINPGLASHGGQVSLVEVAEDQVAILQFGGGCQGCSMVDATLKEGVEKTLLERLPELKGVRDVTDHSQKDNAFF